MMASLCPDGFRYGSISAAELVLSLDEPSPRSLWAALSAREGNAACLDASEVYCEGARNGIEMASLEARNKLRYIRPAEENEE